MVKLFFREGMQEPQAELMSALSAEKLMNA
jgi:hypothetical protein